VAGSEWLLGTRWALLQRKRQAERALRPLARYRLIAGLEGAIECRSVGPTTVGPTTVGAGRTHPRKEKRRGVTAALKL
jgi:hypothetical protein